MRKVMVCAALAIATVRAATAVGDWPNRPVTMVVPFAAGGTTDVLGRVMAKRIGEILGQQIVLENVGGSGGMAGSLRVARAQPDGSQFLFAGLGPLVLTQALQKKPAFDSIADFEPVGLVAEVPLVLLVRKDLPVASLQEFIAHTAANASRMTFASAGSGSAPHIGCVLLNTVMQTYVTHVPYRGSGPAMQDLIGGRIDFFCEALPTALAQIRAGSVKPIALLTRERSKLLPDLPTAQEQGLAGFEAYTWFALYLPRATPRAIVHRLHRAAVQTIQTAWVRESLEELGVTMVTPDRATPEYLTRFMQVETEKWQAAVKASGLIAE
jgi:tripartite-type tricarboxylate transporter receptor subunit TctC